MLRRLTALLLCFLFIPILALGESGVLPKLPGESSGILPEPVADGVISYGVEMNVYPSSTGTLPSGEWQEQYRGVTTAQYRSFGVLLGEKGYAAEDVHQEGTTTALTLVRGELRIAFLYDAAARTLTMTYPAGVTTAIGTVSPQTAWEHVTSTVHSLQGAIDDAIPTYGEEDLFEGFTLLSLGDTVDLAITDSYTLIGNVHLRLTPTAMHWQEPMALCKTHPGDQYVLTGDTTAAWLEATIVNLGSREAAPSDLRTSMTTSLQMDSGITLHYISADGHYTYRATAGKVVPEGRISIGTVETKLFVEYTAAHKLGSLETGDFAFFFEDVPEALLNAEDGILALTFIPTEGTRYVYYLRQPY